jgi:hypothetical protein
MAECADCHGSGSVEAIACPGYIRITLPCPTCAATGEMTSERAVALADAERLRQDRLRRGLTLRQEAARLGMKPSALSRLENAR